MDAILIFHGFGGSYSELEPLDNFLKSNNYHTYCPTFAGHESTRKAFRKATHQQWLSFGEDVLTDISLHFDKVYIIGFSMGAMVALNIASKYSVDGIILLNTPLFEWDFKIISKNLVTHPFKYSKKYITSSFKNPLHALLEFKKLQSLTKKKLHLVKCPVFIAQSMRDDTVRLKSARFVYDNIGSTIRQLHFYYNSEHLICHGIDSHILFPDIQNFIENLRF